MLHRERANFNKIKQFLFVFYFYEIRMGFRKQYFTKLENYFVEDCVIAKCQNLTKLGIFFYYFFKDCGIAKEQILTKYSNFYLYFIFMK